MNEFLEIFPVPIKQIMLDAVKQSQLLDIINTIDQEKLENNLLIKNGYRSKTNTFLNRKLWLKEIFQTEVDNFTADCGIIPANISYSWCNRYIDKGTISPHKHEMSVVSGVFYPLIRGSGSFLNIKNPCTPFKVNEISTKTTKFTQQEFSISIKENMLILFPSWVEHYSKNEATIKYAISFDTEIVRCPG